MSDNLTEIVFLDALVMTDEARRRRSRPCWRTRTHPARRPGRARSRASPRGTRCSCPGPPARRHHVGDDRRRDLVTARRRASRQPLEHVGRAVAHQGVLRGGLAQPPGSGRGRYRPSRCRTARPRPRRGTRCGPGPAAGRRSSRPSRRAAPRRLPSTRVRRGRAACGTSAATRF